MGKLSVSEFAETTGTSKQAVYQKMKTSLKEFVIEENGMKYIDEKALDLPSFKGVVQPCSTLNKGVETELKRELSEKTDLIKFLQSQIEELQKANREKDEHIREQSKKLAVLLEQSQELQRNNQLLLGMASQTGEPEEPAETIIQTVENVPEPKRTEEPEKGLKGLFKRFKR